MLNARGAHTVGELQKHSRRGHKAGLNDAAAPGAPGDADAKIGAVAGEPSSGDVVRAVANSRGAYTELRVRTTTQSPA